MHVSHILKKYINQHNYHFGFDFFAMVTISYVSDYTIATAILIEVFITLTNIPPNNS